MASALLRSSLALAAVLGAIGLAGAQASPASPKLVLTPCHIKGVAQELRCGVYPVFENRQTRTGRTLPLKVVELPATGPHPGWPIVMFGGGPGETNTNFAQDLASWSLRADHPILLVDSRGTGEGHRLACHLSAPKGPEGYFASPFAPSIARACRKTLEEAGFDLSQYSTAAMADDLDEVRQALGYDKLELVGGSFGTYAAMSYARRHRAHVHTAYLQSLVTLENRVPLYHAWAAQWGLDQLMDQCDADAACHGAYPNLRTDFTAVQARLRQGPVRVTVRGPDGGRLEVDLTEPAFADAIRVMMYSGEAGRGVPQLVEQARAGRFEGLAQAAADANRGFYSAMPLGLYYAVTCTEFADRVRAEEIAVETRGSYAGAWRAQDQVASCREWPRTTQPADWFQPFASDVPALLLSGDTDPVAPPRWGEVVHGFMPNSIHIVVPGGHVPASECTDAIAGQMFRAGSTKGLDMSCLKALKPAPFKLPAP